MTDEKLTHLDPLVRIEAKIEKLQMSVAVIENACPVCKATLEKHERTLYGNGGPGVLARLIAAETGKVDTLSVKSINHLIKGVVALATGVAAAVAVIVTAVAKLLFNK